MPSLAINNINAHLGWELVVQEKEITVDWRENKLQYFIMKWPVWHYSVIKIFVMS